MSSSESEKVEKERLNRDALVLCWRTGCSSWMNPVKNLNYFIKIQGKFGICLVPFIWNTLIKMLSHLCENSYLTDKSLVKHLILSIFISHFNIPFSMIIDTDFPELHDSSFVKGQYGACFCWHQIYPCQSVLICSVAKEINFFLWSQIASGLPSKLH